MQANLYIYWAIIAQTNMVAPSARIDLFICRNDLAALFTPHQLIAR
jgi:hypothetical protein